MQTQLLLVLFFAIFTIKASQVRPIEYDVSVQENRKSVAAKVIEILQGREEMANVIRYLELAERDLQDKLPKFDQGGKEIPYVFFAPTAWAFITTIPHNVGDLFIHDAELRLNVLLRHFAANFSDNLLLENVNALRMADGKEATLRHIGQEHLINDRVLKAYECGNASGTEIADYPIQIYVVDGLFVVQQEINSAISRYINRQRPPASRPSADDVNPFKVQKNVQTKQAVEVNMSSPITTHVLNTATGTPGRNMLVSLHRKISDSSWEIIKSGQTNEDGRLPGLITKEQFIPGTYKMFFDTGAYFEALKITTFYPHVEVVFNIINELEHYHIPLLISPFGYSTYRGS